MVNAVIRKIFERELFYEDSEFVERVLTHNFRDMQREIVLALPLDSSAIQFTWSWYIYQGLRYQGVPDRDLILRKWSDRCNRGLTSVTIELLGVNELRGYSDRINIPRRPTSEMRYEERVGIITRHEYEWFDLARQEIVPIIQRSRQAPLTPEQLESKSKQDRCIYNAHSRHIKCAVNPSIECSDCRDFEEKLGDSEV